MEPDASVHDEQLRRAPARLARAGDWSSSTPRLLADTVLEAATRGAGRARRAGRRPSASPNQRASTIVWDRATGEPIGPAIGWQDLRTIGMCLEQQANGFRFAPNVSATKIAWLLDTYDPERTRDLCFGTVDTWVTWVLTEGACHVTDASNAAITGVLRGDGSGWSAGPLEALRIPAVDAADASSTRAGSSARRPRCRARRRSRPSSATSRRRCSARRACARARRRSRSAPAGCSNTVLGDRPGVRDPRRRRHVPDHHVAARRRGHVGPRGDHARGRHERGVAARRPRDPRELGRERRGRAAVRRHRWRRVRPRAARPRHPAVGLRRARHRARAHPRHRPAGARARGARRRRAPRRGSRRVGRDRLRAHDRRPADRRRHVPQRDVRAGARRTRRRSRSRCRR